MALTVFRRDRFARVLGIECPHCSTRIELQGKRVTDIEDGTELIGTCPNAKCAKRFSVSVGDIGGYLWEPPKS
jgi:hypothetical protein